LNERALATQSLIFPFHSKDLKQELKVRSTTRTSLPYEDISLTTPSNNNPQSDTSTAMLQNLSLNGDSGSEALERLRGGSRVSSGATNTVENSMTSTASSNLKRKMSSILNRTRLYLKVNTILNPRRYVCGHNVNPKSAQAHDTARNCNKCEDKSGTSSSDDDYRPNKGRMAK
jgi:hypothetical protein